MQNLPSQTLLEGIVGSTAYGLDRPGSDIDRLGVIAYPARDYWRLADPPETIVLHEPDITRHEVAKYVRLALKCNPTVLELMWLDEYISTSYWGDRLIEIRQSFLSEPLVRSAYGGYAKAQVERLKRRQAEGKVGFSSDTQKRTAKHARHCFRLLRQGQELLETGNITIKLPDPETFWAFDDYTVEDIDREFAKADEIFKNTKSTLPAEPNKKVVSDFLYDVRFDSLRWFNGA